MDFTARTDVGAPIDFAFNALSDFESFERAALRRGAEVVRIDRLGRAGAGMKWRATFPLRGKQRLIEIALATYDRPTLLHFDGDAKNLAGEMAVELLELSRQRTRVHIKLTVRPQTLAARIMLQSLRLAKGRMVARLQTRVDAFGSEIEDRYRRSGTA